MSFPTKAEQDQKARAIEFGNATERGLAAIYAEHPTIVRNQACDSMIGSICAEYEGLQAHQVAPSLDTFRDALAADPGILTSLTTKAINKQRIEIISDIIELLRAPSPDGRGGRYSAFNLVSVENQMKSWSLEALKERKAEIIREQELVKRPISELRKIVVDARPSYGFPKLPKILMVGLTPVTIDRAYLKQLPAWELRRYQKVYGNAQLDSRLAE
jgi:hypothetical protein